MAKPIMVKHGVITKISKDLCVGRSTIKFALLGDDGTDLKKRIRKAALKLGGIITEF